MKKMLLKSIITALIFFVGISSASAIQWYEYNEGISVAQKSDKPMMIYFYRGYYDTGYRINFDEPEITNALSNFICIKINMDDGANLTKSNNIMYSPTTVFVNKKKQEILRLQGAVNSKNFISKISEAWNKKDEVGQPFQLLENGYKKEIYNLGKLTIKEYNSKLKNLNEEERMDVEVEIKAEINEATIRKLSGPDGDSFYTLTLDDGTGTMSKTYKGGLGDINIGDKVNVIIDSHKITEISKNNIVGSQYKTTSSDDTSSKTTPGFGFIAGVFAVFVFYWKKMKD